MKKEKRIVLGSLVVTGLIFGLYMKKLKQKEKEKKEMKDFNKKVGETLSSIGVEKEPLYTKDFERKEFSERMMALSRDEWEIVAELMPLDLCMGRIQHELDKAEELRNSVKSLLVGLGGGQ